MAELSDNPTRPLQQKKTTALPPRFQSYAKQTLAELTEKLVKVSKEEKGQSLSSRTRDIVYVLKVHKLRHSANAHVFLGGRGVESLLSLLSLCSEQEGRDRGLLLATLANLCALHGDCRSKVVGHGLSQIASALILAQSPATLCTVARLIANLALDPANIPRLQAVGVVRELSHTLIFQTASDSASKLSVLRAVRLLGSSSSCREELKSSEGLPGLVECLKSEEERVAESALHALHILLADSDPDVVQALVTHKGLSPVVRLCNHGDREVGERAVEVLVRCAGVSEGRAGLHSADGVECLLDQLQGLEPRQRLYAAVVGALSASCRDVVGRQRMRDCGGLERLIQLLASPEHSSLHPDILSALVCYYFDEQSLKFMVKRLGLLRALTFHLQQISSSANEAASTQESGKTPLPVEDGAGEGETKEEREESFRGSVEEESGSATGSGCSPSTTNSGFDTATSQAPSSPATLPPPDQHSTPSGSSPNSSHSPSSPSLPSTPSPSPPFPPADTQPLPKRPRLSSDMEFTQPTPVNFLDSLLSSPSPYQTPPRRPELPATPDPTSSLESHVVQLLSRVSHLRDCLPHLAARDLLLATLNCLLSSPSFLASHIFKTLSRVFANPNCFQEAICCLVPSRLHHQLCLSPTLSPPSFNLGDLFDFPSPVPSLPSPHTATPGPAPGSGLAHMCRELLSQLSRVGQSPYGQGVLAHLLLTGEEREQTASALAAPLLCWARRVLKRLMIDFRGQGILIDLVTSSSDLRESAADSLLSFTYSLETPTTQEFLSLIFPLLPDPEPPTETSPHTPTHLACRHSGVGCAPRCRYHDYDNTPFDYSVKLDRHGTGTERHGTGTEHVHLLAHRAVLMGASQVFNVMLSGHFMESGGSEVYLRGVHPTAFLSLLHHIYGCGWDCSDAMETWLPDDGSHDDQSDISSSLMSAVVSNYDYSRPKVLQTLRCLATASRFLLDSMRESCERQAASFVTMTTLVPLFLFSLLHGSVILGEKCLRCLFFRPPSPARRTCLLQLASCPESSAAMELLRSLVSSKLHTTP